MGIMNIPLSQGRRATLAVDLHVHSCFSYDSFMRPEKIIAAARKKGLAGVAIVDHDSLEGGLAGLKHNTASDFIVIPGAEIQTPEGEIIGLFLKRKPASRDFSGVVNDIREQGGVVVLPHPLVSPWEYDSVLPEMDAIEVFNSRYGTFIPPKPVKTGNRISAAVAGSDAHFYSEIGRAVTLFPPPLTPENFRDALLNGAVEWRGKRSSFWGRYAGQAIKMLKTRRLPVRSES